MTGATHLCNQFQIHNDQFSDSFSDTRYRFFQMSVSHVAERENRPFDFQ